MLSLVFSSHAQRFLKKCDDGLCERIISKIEKLKDEPFPSDSKRIKGRKDKHFRVRVGNYRVLYSVNRGTKELVIEDIDKRSRAYLCFFF